MRLKTLLTIILCLCLGAVWAQDNGDLPPFLYTPEEDQQADSEDLEMLRQRLNDLDFEMANLLAAIKNTEKEQQSIRDKVTAFTITGSGYTNVRHFNLDGPGVDAAKDFLGREIWFDESESQILKKGSKANQNFTFSLAGKPFADFEVASDLKAGLIWAGITSIAYDNLRIQGNFNNLKIIGGTFPGYFTPLTLAYDLNENKYEHRHFQDQREGFYQAQGITPGFRKLEGINASYQDKAVFLEGFGARIRTKSTESPYFRFLFGFNSKFSIADKLNLGVTWTDLLDDAASGSGGEPLENQLLGFNLHYTYRPGIAAGLELARSKNVENTTAEFVQIWDTASLVSLEISKKAVELNLKLINNGPNYVAPTSQGRDHKLSSLSLFEPGKSIAASGEILTKYEYEGLPFGLATPNRKGYNIQLTAYPNGWEFYFENSRLSEIKERSFPGLVCNYATDKLGASFNLKNKIRIGKQHYPQKDLLFTGSVEQRRASNHNGSAEFDLKYRGTDLGFTYQLTNNVGFFAAQKMLKTQGVDRGTNLDNQHRTTVYGLEISLGSKSSLEVWQQFVSYLDSTGSANDFAGGILGLSAKAKF